MKLKISIKKFTNLDREIFLINLSFYEVFYFQIILSIINFTVKTISKMGF